MKLLMPREIDWIQKAGISRLLEQYYDRESNDNVCEDEIERRLDEKDATIAALRAQLAKQGEDSESAGIKLELGSTLVMYRSLSENDNYEIRYQAYGELTKYGSGTTIAKALRAAGLLPSEEDSPSAPGCFNVIAGAQG